MDLTTVVTILAGIATVIFGSLSIYLFIRKKYPGKISFINQNTVNLFDSLIKNFEEISIYYDSKPIKEHLIYLKFGFINEGDIDIEGNQMEGPLKLELKDGYKWKKVKLTNSSNDLNVNRRIVSNSKCLEIDFGLYRKEEFFQFEALVEMEKDYQSKIDIFNNIKINHRISNTQKIKEKYIPNKEGLKEDKYEFIFLACMFLLVPIIMFVINAKNIINPNEDFNIVYLDKDSSKYELNVLTENRLEMTNLMNEKSQVITFKEFKNDYSPIFENIQKDNRQIIYIISFMVLAVCVFIVLIYNRYRKLKKLYELIELNKMSK